MFSTKDVSLATYIRYVGHAIIEHRVVESHPKRKQSEWTFDITEDQAKQLKLDYVNSEFGAFEGVRRSLTKQRYG